MVRHGRAASMNGSRSKAGMTVVGVAAEEAGIASYSDVIPDLVGDLSRPVRSEVPDEIHSASLDLEGQNGQTLFQPKCPQLSRLNTKKILITLVRHEQKHAHPALGI